MPSHSAGSSEELRTAEGLEPRQQRGTGRGGSLDSSVPVYWLQLFSVDSVRMAGQPLPLFLGQNWVGRSAEPVASADFHFVNVESFCQKEATPTEKGPGSNAPSQAVSVSRAHAQIVVAPNGDGWIEDNNSMNGTFLSVRPGSSLPPHSGRRGEGLTQQQPGLKLEPAHFYQLSDGCQIAFGNVQVIFAASPSFPYADPSVRSEPTKAPSVLANTAAAAAQLAAPTSSGTLPSAAERRKNTDEEEAPVPKHLAPPCPHVPVAGSSSDLASFVVEPPALRLRQQSSTTTAQDTKERTEQKESGEKPKAEVLAGVTNSPFCQASQRPLSTPWGDSSINNHGRNSDVLARDSIEKVVSVPPTPERHQSQPFLPLGASLGVTSTESPGVNGSEGHKKEEEVPPSPPLTPTLPPFPGAEGEDQQLNTSNNANGGPVVLTGASADAPPFVVRLEGDGRNGAGGVNSRSTLPSGAQELCLVPEPVPVGGPKAASAGTGSGELSSALGQRRSRELNEEAEQRRKSTARPVEKLIPPSSSEEQNGLEGEESRARKRPRYEGKSNVASSCRVVLPLHRFYVTGMSMEERVELEKLYHEHCTICGYDDIPTSAEDADGSGVPAQRKGAIQLVDFRHATHLLVGVHDGTVPRSQNIVIAVAKGLPIVARSYFEHLMEEERKLPRVLPSDDGANARKTDTSSTTTIGLINQSTWKEHVPAVRAVNGTVVSASDIRTAIEFWRDHGALPLSGWSLTLAGVDKLKAPSATIVLSECGAELVKRKPRKGRDTGVHKLTDETLEQLLCAILSPLKSPSIADIVTPAA